MLHRYAFAAFSLVAAPLVAAQPAGWAALGDYSLPVASEDALYAVRGGDVYRSDDLGDTWQTVPTDGVPPVGQLRVGEDGRLLILSGNALYRQAASGAFDRMSVPKAEAIVHVTEAGGALLLAAQDDYGAPVPTGLIYRSEDEGQTWALADVPGETDELFQTDLRSLQRGPDGRLFAVVQWDGGYGSALTSSDDGQTWSYLDGYPRDHLFTLLPLSNGEVIAGADGTFRADASLSTWTSIDEYESSWPLSAAEGEGAIVFISHDQVRFSPDWGESWEAVQGAEGFSGVVSAMGHFFFDSPSLGLYRVPIWRYTSSESGAEAALALSVAPNPAIGSASISLTLASAGTVRLAVYDVLGREVAVLHDGPTVMRTGYRTPDLPAGTYVAVLHAEGRAETARFTVVR